MAKYIEPLLDFQCYWKLGSKYYGHEIVSLPPISNSNWGMGGSPFPPISNFHWRWGSKYYFKEEVQYITTKIF